MTNKYITKEKLIQLLDDAIENEIQKPTEETDMEFVTECEHLINALMGNEHEYTNEDAERYFAEIMKKKKAKKHTFLIQRKKVIAASIAIFFIFLSGLTLYAFNPTIKDIILKTLNLEVGQSIDKDGVTYTYLGETKKYDSVEALIKAENLNILYPKELPDGCYIESIYVMEHNIAIKYTDSSIGLLITYNFHTDQIPNGDEYFINNQKFIIAKYHDRYEAYTIIDQDLYTIRSISEDILFILINSLE